MVLARVAGVIAVCVVWRATSTLFIVIVVIIPTGAVPLKGVVNVGFSPCIVVILPEDIIILVAVFIVVRLI
jgi:hypothetical protein